MFKKNPDYKLDYLQQYDYSDASMSSDNELYKEKVKPFIIEHLKHYKTRLSFLAR